MTSASATICSVTLACRSRLTEIGNAVADQRPDAPQQFPFPVLEMLGHRRAMQVEIDAVEMAGGRDILQQHRRDALEGVLGDMRRRGRRAP